MTSPAFVPHMLEGTPYRLEALLGEGAMGEVFLAEHLELRRKAVIKVIRARFASEGNVVERMRREARIVARIRHDSLVTVYDLGTAANGRLYMAMEYLAGTVLRGILRARGSVTAVEAAEWMAQACEGLDVAHREGVIHRDIKPENLFVTHEGRLKVLDFGLAKPTDEDATGMNTAAGMVLGTPRYMAPEQTVGKPLSTATDVYAIGCVLFELLTGRPVFDAQDTREMLWNHLHATPSTLAARCGRSFDAELESITARALRKDPKQRWQRASELATALRAVHARLVASGAVNAGTTRVEVPDPTSLGMVTTEQAAVPPSIVRTSPTEKLEPTQMGATANLATQVSTAPTERRPLSPVVVVIGLLAIVIGSITLIAMLRHDETPTAAAPTAKTEKADKHEKTENSAAPLVASQTAIPTPTASPTLSAAPSVTSPIAPALTAKAKAKPVASNGTVAPSALERARALINEGDLDGAELEARDAIATHGNAARLLLGEILERKGKPDLAREQYKRVLESDPNNGTAKTRLAKLGG